MRIVRIKSYFVITIFTAGVLFADEPPQKQVALPPQPSAEEAKAPLTSTDVIDNIPNITSKTDVDRATDIFLKGGFCVVTALLFLAGFLAVKSNSGQKTYTSS